MRDHVDDVALHPTRLVGATPDSSVNPQHAAVLRLQREAGNGAVASLLEDDRSPVLDVVGSGSGSTLPADTRSGMEAHFGTDFSGVRVHTGDSAAASARSVQAHAYTVGNDVVLGDGIDPSSASGQRTLAHELTHVVQQRAGDVDGTPAGGGIRVSDPSDRFEQEAERVADHVTSGPAETPASAGAATAGAVMGVQREGETDEEKPEDEALQALSIQREGETDGEKKPEDDLLGG